MALRLHRPGYRSLSEIEAELLWMDMLSANGMTVPKPIPAVDGTVYKAFDDGTVSLLDWLDGTPWSELQPSLNQYFELGRSLSKMHSLADNWRSPPGFHRHTWDLLGDQPTWDRFWDNPQLTVDQRKRLIRFREEAARGLDSLGPLDIGLIHADLVPDNVLSFGAELQFIDFDDGGFGYRLFDLATITRRARLTQADGKLANAVIEGYSKERFIHVSALPLFEALRACTYVGWNIARIGEHSGQARNARYIEEALAAIDRLN